jgi:hypothetical protein
MKFLYTVASRHDTLVPIEAKTAGGRAVMGSVPGSIVELLPLDRGQRSVTLVFSSEDPADVAEAAKFVDGATVTITVSV